MKILIVEDDMSISRFLSLELRHEDYETDTAADGRTALEVEAGTTGFVGKDCRNAGGRTYIGINCICGDFYFEPVKNDNGQISGIKIACCGDDGLDSILKALGFVMQALTDQVNEIDD